jgi:transcriptional regulator GlxA family with amidase domain
MQIALVLYPKFTMLDIVGPFQVLGDVPGHDVVFVASSEGHVPDHTGITGLEAQATLDGVPNPDVVVVPGGFGDTELDLDVVHWLRRVHETTTWTTSVCTGSIYLAAAGILAGLDATTHWARKERLEQLGAHYSEDRVVERGKVITAAGVSSGIDMALTLLGRMYGPEMAEMIQLAIEYDPHPPFDAGSPTKASPGIVEAVRGTLADTLSDDAVLQASHVGSQRSQARFTTRAGCGRHGRARWLRDAPRAAATTRRSSGHISNAHTS